MNKVADTAPLWARHLGDLCRRIADGTGVPSRPEAWQIVYFNLSRYLRYHAARAGRVDPDDLDDIASQKTLELMRKVDTSTGPMIDLDADRIPGFLSTVARNGLMTFLKRSGRTIRESDHGEVPGVRAAPDRMNPSAVLESREYALALSGCVSTLETRARTMWFFRVCYGMSSKDIARHPRVMLAPNHVDVVLHRTREKVKECMHQKNHETDRIPPGTFGVLWSLLHPIDESRQEAL